MRIAILGTRGIPNNYGGFEQFAQYLGEGLAEKGHDVAVYTPHNHPYKGNSWGKVSLIKCFDPEYKIGTVGQFVYDLNCILDSRKRSFDIILQLGYTSSSIFSAFFPKKALIATNMDGLEWKRTKYGPRTRKFLKYAEKVAVKRSHYLVADSLEIQKYLKNTYGCPSEFIAYGATIFNEPEVDVLNKYSLQPYQYDMLIARLEPENNIETILDGVAQSSAGRPFLVIGNYQKTFGRYLTEKFKDIDAIRFLGPEYDHRVINNLRYHSNLYFHGHSVGGTNPSLLEAMSSHALIASHRNNFNAAILGKDAYYFSDAAEVSHLLQQVRKESDEASGMIRANLEKIQKEYSWNLIINRYEEFFKSIIRKRDNS